MLAHRRLERVGVYTVNGHGPSGSMTFHEDHDGLFLSPSALPGPLSGCLGGKVLRARLAPDVSFVNLHHAAQEPSHRLLPHRFPHPMREKPCRLQRNPQLTRELMAADAFLAAGHEMDGCEPFGEGGMRVFEDRPDTDGELFTAGFALVHARTHGLRRARLRG
jgi:hypothetical protein